MLRRVHTQHDPWANIVHFLIYVETGYCICHTNPHMSHMIDRWIVWAIQCRTACFAQQQHHRLLLSYQTDTPALLTTSTIAHGSTSTQTWHTPQYNHYNACYSPAWVEWGVQKRCFRRGELVLRRRWPLRLVRYESPGVGESVAMSVLTIECCVRSKIKRECINNNKSSKITFDKKNCLTQSSPLWFSACKRMCEVPMSSVRVALWVKGAPRGAEMSSSEWTQRRQ